jgi:hypothetical protein
MCYNKIVLEIGGFVMKKFVCLLLLVATACASPARVEMMVPDLSAPAIAATNELSSSVGLAVVDAGKKDHPSWWTGITDNSLAGALRRTLGDQGLLAKHEDEARYQLEARLVSFVRPAAAANPTADITILYVVRDTRTGGTVFDEAISSKGAATLAESKQEDERSGLAGERAMRDNLGQFANKFMAAISPPPAKTAKPKLKPQ